MLLCLTLSDFVLVERLDLVFEPGFSVLTGETGAGKSILLDALDLVLGERADGSVVREGAARADISAEFSLADAPGLLPWLEEAGLEVEGDTLLLRRVVEAGGRSRAFINGRPATLQQLKEAGERLVDIHGQHAHYSLMQPGVQRALLDAYGHATELAGRTAQAWRDWQIAARRRREAEQRSAADAAERERLAWTVGELEQLAFRPEEWQALQEEHRRLAHAAELIEGARAVATLLDAEEGGVISGLKLAKGRLEALTQFDPQLAACAEMLDGGLIQAQETVRELARYVDRVELDPQALAAAEARIGEVMATARKLHVAPEALPHILEESRARLSAMQDLADLDGLALREAQAEADYRRLAGVLSQRRAQAATRLGEAVTAVMQQLAMQGGRLEVGLMPCAPEAGGLETVEFLVSPHPGQALRPLAKTASGGELSRLGLALQTVLAGESGAGTLIFDEVDAGIGGGVAEIVGHLLAEVGRHKQVLCVTHLPQVAARAAHHWRVTKESKDGRAVSRVSRLSGEERVEEIARMLGGVQITDTTRRHAAEMIHGSKETAKRQRRG